MELVTKALEQLKSQSGDEESTLGQQRLDALPTIQLTGLREGSDESRAPERGDSEDQSRKQNHGRTMGSLAHGRRNCQVRARIRRGIAAPGNGPQSREREEIPWLLHSPALLQFLPVPHIGLI